MGAATIFADLGVLAYEEGTLVDGLKELSLRLDLAGAGDLLDVLMGTCWGTDRDDCPHCHIPVRYHRDKGTPDPHPKPPPPPPPPPDPKSECRFAVVDPTWCNTHASYTCRPNGIFERGGRVPAGSPPPPPKKVATPPPPPPPQPGSGVAAGSDSAWLHARCPGVESDPTGTAEPSEAADPRCGWG